jgi:phosphoribosylanthranilate isomerase
MPNPLLISAGSIANLTDARYFAAREVHFLGFCLEESNENYVQAAVVKAMKEWIEGPKIVGKFGLQSTEEILFAIENIGLDAVQLSMFAEVDKKVLRDKTILIQEYIIEKTTRTSDFLQQIEQFSANFDYLYLDFTKSDISWNDLVRNSEISIELLQRTCQKYKVFLSLSFLPKQLKAIIDVLQPAGIAVKGGEEEQVGVKSFDDLDDIFDEIETW